MLLTFPSGDNTGVPVSHNGTQRTYCGRVRRIRVKAVFLVLLLVLAVSASNDAVFDYVAHSITFWNNVNVYVIPPIVIIIFCGPLSGWLADTKFGRYRVLQVSLWSMWIGMAGLIVIDINVTNAMVKNVLKSLCGMPLFCGFSGFMANAVQFAIDQMPEASSEEVSAFIHWYVWVVFIGRALPKILLLLSSPSCSNLSIGGNDKVFTFLLMLGMLTFGMIVGILFRNTLTVMPESRNPMKTVIHVLRYSAAHKYPENRRAHTYTDACIPSRLDLGKEIYGGPFTTEQVEDVKTFLRILTVILTTTAVVLPLELCGIPLQNLVDHFQSFSGESQCLKKASGLVYSLDILIGLSIPLYELFVYPLAQRWVPKILHKTIIGAVLVVFVVIFLLIIDSVGHYMRDAPCIFTSSLAHNIALPINYLAVDIPAHLLLSLVIMLYWVALFEFICAQSPYNMKGLLLGLGYSAIYLGSGIAVFIQVWWYYRWDDENTATTPSCDFWYYLMVTIIAVLALVLVVLVVRCYHQRQREEPNHDRMHVEEYYERNIT